jgi:hypothetical protein
MNDNILFPICPRCKSEWDVNSVAPQRCYKCKMYLYRQLLDWRCSESEWITWMFDIKKCLLDQSGKETELPYLPYDVSIETLNKYLILL